MYDQEKSINPADVKKTYGFYAPIYDLLFGVILEPGRRALCKEVALLKPVKILEVGVGTGLLLSQYPVSSQITGVDLSDEMLEVAKRRVKKLPHMKIHLEIMDAEHLEFADASFDCVVLPYVLSVTPNPEALIKELQRVCEKNGTIIILNHFSGSGVWYLLEKLVKNLAEKIGFRSEFSYETHIIKNKLEVTKLQKVNLFGLSKLVVIRNT
jgi:phosphatidylethanolamine/phosphatidyl-N-methylethanolamine N-methyltransferase